MTLTTVIPYEYVGPNNGVVPNSALTTGIGSAVNLQFNAAGDKAGFVFQADTTAPDDAISFLVATVTTAGSAGDVEATLETVGTDGLPSGTPVTNSATGTQTISTTGVKTITGIAGTAVLTPGTLYSYVLTAGSGWNRDLSIRRTTGTGSGLGLPYSGNKDAAGSWAMTALSSTGINYGLSTGGVFRYVAGLCGASSAVALQAYSDATNPDERGNRFSFAVPKTLIGAVVGITTGNGATTPGGADDDFTVFAYTGTAGSPSQIASSVILGEQQYGALSKIIMFDTANDLSANTEFRLSVKSTDTGTINLVRWDYASNAHLGAMAGINCYSTTRNGGSGSFTDDDAKVYSIFPLFSKSDNGAGAGGNPFGGSIF